MKVQDIKKQLFSQIEVHLYEFGKHTVIMHPYMPFDAINGRSCEKWILANFQNCSVIISKLQDIKIA